MRTRLKIPTLRVENIVDPDDPRCIKYEDEAIVDLDRLDEFVDLWCIDLPQAEVFCVPQNYSPKTLQYLGILWNPQWSNLVTKTGATYLSIAGADQQALDMIDRRICDSDGRGRVVLRNPRTSAITRWFSRNFDCPAVHITDTESADLRTADEFHKIDVLSIEDVKQVRGLHHLASKGTIGTLILRNSEVLDAENFWNMNVQLVILDFHHVTDARWFIDVWAQRPVDWKEKVIFSGPLAEDLYPEWSDINSYESVTPEVPKSSIESLHIERDDFWQLIDESRARSEGDVGSILEELEAMLAEQPAELIAAFHFEMIKVVFEGDRNAIGLHDLVVPVLQQPSAVFAAILHGNDFFEEFRNGIVDLKRLGISDPEDLDWSSNIVFVAGTQYLYSTGLDIQDVFGAAGR